MRCKHCRKNMETEWYKTSGGYCYRCSMVLGFSLIRETIIRKFFGWLYLKVKK